MPQQKYPVYIWIHGGAYQVGSGNMGYPGIFKAFTSTGIIVVSINYRLNVFGETWKPVCIFNLRGSVS
jgi:para-nitrobenzyl esterase